MADNVTVDNGTGTDYSVASDKVTYSGDADQAVQLVRLVNVTGSEGSKTVTEVVTANGVFIDGTSLHVADTPVDAMLNDHMLLSDGSAALPLAVMPQVFNGSTWDRIRGDTTNGVDVDVTRLPALVAGTANIGDVDVLTLPGVAGTAAHASPTSGNPVYVAGRASTAIPTDVGADGDAAGMWTNRNGATVVLQAPHVGLNSDPWNLVHEGAQYTTAQTSTVLVAGGASEKVVVTQCQIQAFSTTSGTCIVYFGTGAFSRGTNRTIFDGEFKPSSTLAPGVVLQGPFIAGTNGDDIMVTSVGDIDLTISVWYYVVT